MTLKHSLIAMALAMAFHNAHATPVFIATGSISGADLSGLTGTLESGVAANILGGMSQAWLGLGWRQYLPGIAGS